MAIVRIEWIDSISTGVIGYNVYRDDVKINSSTIPPLVQKYDDNNAVKDVSHKYVVQTVSNSSETTAETLNSNLKNITPNENIVPLTWELLWETDFSDGTIGEVRGWNGASVSVVNGLLENWKPTSNAAGIIPNTPSGGWVSERMYKFETTIESVTSNELPLMSYKETWGNSNTQRVNLKDVGLPYTHALEFTKNNTVVSSGIVTQGENFFQGDVMRFSNVKFYQLI